MTENNISIGRQGNGSEISIEDIPDDWELPEVGEVSGVNSNPKSDETDVPYLPMDALDTEMPSPKYTERRNPKENSGTMFKQYDTLFAKITPSTENGKSGYIDDMDTSVGIATTEVITLSPEKTHPLYLYYYANSHPSKEYAVSRMRGTSGRQRVPKSVFERELKIPLPNRQEQRRIASILYSVDEQLRTLNDRHDRLSELKHGLMQDLLTGRKRFEGEEISLNSSEFEGYRVEDEPSVVLANWSGMKLPDGWSRKNLSDSIEVTTGQSFSSDRFVDEGDYILIKNKTVKEQDAKVFIDGEIEDKYVIDDGDLLVTMDGEFVPRLWNLGDAALNQRVCKLETNSDIDNRYLRYALEYPLEHIQRYKAGTTVKHLSSKDFDDIYLPVPSLEEQERIASILYTVDEMIARTSDLRDEYERLKRGLMQDLLSGDVRTPEQLTVLDEISTEASNSGTGTDEGTQRTLDV